MKKTFAKTAAACGLCLTLLAGGSIAGAAYGGAMNQMDARAAFNRMETALGGRQGGQAGGFGQNDSFGQNNPFGQAQGSVQYAASPTEVAEGVTTNSAASLTADEANATTIVMSGENSSVKIKESGTYIVTGSCADGNITVTKGTTGVVLILRDLDLTSTTGATLSINKGAEAKIVVSGDVTLTDAEDPADEDVSEDYDGAALKVKAGARAYLTGSGTLTLNGEAKNGVKVSGDADDEEGYGSFVIDGATVNINAANDGVNANYDVAILSGKVTVSAGDDGIHADHILTIGSADTSPTVTISNSTEGLEATVVNIAGGTVSVTASDDGVNAANADGLFKGELDYSINITGGSVTVNARTDGLDSNGNINLIAGSATIRSANNGGDAGIDYDGEYYISDEFELNNYSGVAGPDNMMGGIRGQMGGMQQSGRQQDQNPGQDRQGGAPAQNNEQAPAQDRQNALPGQDTGRFSAQDRQDMFSGQVPNWELTQNPGGMFGTPDQDMDRTPMQDRGLGPNGSPGNRQGIGGMWFNGAQAPFRMQQPMR